MSDGQRSGLEIGAEKVAVVVRDLHHSAGPLSRTSNMEERRRALLTIAETVALLTDCGYSLLAAAEDDVLKDDVVSPPAITRVGQLAEAQQRACAAQSAAGETANQLAAAAAALSMLTPIFPRPSEPASPFAQPRAA